jgi:Peptidase family M23
MRRVLALLPVLLAFQAGAPPALAWTWPADGPVLRPFTLGDDPYAGGQHRGIDVAGPAGAPVRSPTAGVVSFAGSVPGSGRSVTVRTSEGHSVTLVHLGTIAVARGALVPEGSAVGTIGPSGDAEHVEPYVHLGVRVTSDPHGYLDPLALLPARDTVPPPIPAPPGDPVPVVPPDVEPPTPAHVAEPAPAPESAPSPAPRPARAVPKASSPALAVAEPPAGEARTPGGAGAARPPVGLPSPSAAPALRPPRVQLRSFEVPAELPGRRAIRARAESLPQPAGRAWVRVAPTVAVAAAIVAVAALAAAGALLLRRRELLDAGPAHASAHVLDERAGRAAENAGASGPAQEDGLVLDGDLERVALGEPESLPDLDRDHDPSELVQVPDDACRRLRAAIATGRFHQVRPRVPSGCGRAETVSAR